MPGYRHHCLPCYRSRSLLLLWILRRFAGSGLGGCVDEESVLRHRAPWIACHGDDRQPRKPIPTRHTNRTSLTSQTVPSQNASCPLSGRHQTHDCKYIHPLGNVARVYLRGHTCSIYHRQCRPEIRQLDRVDRRPAWSPNLPYTIWPHVDPRQLDGGQEGANLALAAYDLLERICDRRWLFHHGCWHIWCGDWADQGLLWRWWRCFLVLCR